MNALYIAYSKHHTFPYFRLNVSAVNIYTSMQMKTMLRLSFRSYKDEICPPYRLNPTCGG